MFSSHMVVQQEKPFVIWGTADAGEQVTVQFAGKKATSTADANGRQESHAARPESFEVKL